jgi:hypothetical protein
VSDVLALELRRLAVAVAEQAAAVAAQADEVAELRRCLLEKADRKTGARLVPALATLTQGRPFAPAEAAALAMNGTGPAAGMVRETVADLADADGGLRAFGRLLQRLQGARFAGLRLEPVVGDRWRVEGAFPAK